MTLLELIDQIEAAKALTTGSDNPALWDEFEQLAANHAPTLAAAIKRVSEILGPELLRVKGKGMDDFIDAHPNAQYAIVVRGSEARELARILGA